MKAVLLAGGKGTRISEETGVKPKPMVEVGGKPILWHIMKLYAAHDIQDFVICCGYKGYVIKEYFQNYFLHASDVTIDLASNGVEIHHRYSEPWRITLVDTGEDTMTGGRLRRVRQYLDDETFCFTYGDGLSDVNITNLIAFHRAQGLKATLTATRPPSRFGKLVLEGSQVTSFREKHPDDAGFVNGGFFVLEPSVFDYLDSDSVVWEQQPLEALATERQLAAFIHEGFWQPMDSLRDRNELEEMWASGNAPWRTW